MIWDVDVVLDKVGLVGAGGVDWRGVGGLARLLLLLGAAGGHGVDTTAQTSETSHCELEGTRASAIEP